MPRRTSNIRTGFAPRTATRRTTRSGGRQTTASRANEAVTTAPRSHNNPRDAWQRLENILASADGPKTKEQLQRELQRAGIGGDVIGLMTSVRKHGGVIVRSVINKQYTSTPSGLEIVGELNKRLRLIASYGANIRGLRRWYQQNRREIDRNMSEEEKSLLHALAQCHEEVFNYTVARQSHHNL